MLKFSIYIIHFYFVLLSFFLVVDTLAPNNINILFFFGVTFHYINTIFKVVKYYLK